MTLQLSKEKFSKSYTVLKGEKFVATNIMNNKVNFWHNGYPSWKIRKNVRKISHAHSWLCLLLPGQKGVPRMDYIFKSILQLDEYNILYSVIKSNNFTRMEDLISIKDEVFQKLQYIDENNIKISPLEPLLLKLRTIEAFYFHLKDKNNLTTVNWKDKNIVSSDIVDEFRMSVYNLGSSTNPKNNSSNSQNNLMNQTI